MNRKQLLQRYVLLNFFTAFCFCLFEWLFFVTKPSALSMSPLMASLAVLGETTLGLFAVLSILSLPLLYLGFWLKKPRRQVMGLAAVAGFFVAVMLFLFADNFTYTLFGFHSASFTDARRYLYLAWFFLLAIYTGKQLVDVLESRYFDRFAKPLLIIVAGLVMGQGAVVAYKLVRIDWRNTAAEGQANLKQRPNIVILSSDGMRAKNLSLYGYTRATTPFLDSIKDQLQVYHNHYTNNSKTTGSVLSMLSGKYPTTTRVVFRPDVFRGKHMFQHLPGVLKNFGYYNADISVRHYVDAYDVNMQNAFDYANGRRMSAEKSSWLPDELFQEFSLTEVFANEVYERAQARVLHASGIKDFENPFEEVMALNTTSRGTDVERLQQLKEFISTSRQPFFVSVHMLNTHGPKFYFEQEHFSKGGQQNNNWMIDFYDDAILNFDTYVKQVYALLQEQGILDNTVLLITSDHGMNWQAAEAIPLVIRFPHGTAAGVFTAASQRIDLAPTLINYLGKTPPQWMEGKSLLAKDLPANRPIFVGGRAASQKVGGWKQVVNPQPPFYTLGSLSLIYCRKIYALNLTRGNLKVKDLRDSSTSCEGSEPLSGVQARNMMLSHLRERGYDVSSLK